MRTCIVLSHAHSLSFCIVHSLYMYTCIVRRRFLGISHRKHVHALDQYSHHRACLWAARQHVRRDNMLRNTFRSTRVAATSSCTRASRYPGDDGECGEGCAGGDASIAEAGVLQHPHAMPCSAPCTHASLRGSGTPMTILRCSDARVCMHACIGLRAIHADRHAMPHA